MFNFRHFYPSTPRRSETTTLRTRLGSGFEQLESRDVPAPLVVNNPLDVEDADPDLTSLREAVKNANDSEAPGQQHITFAPNMNGATITLTDELPIFTKNIFIDGPAAKVTVQRDTTKPGFRIFTVGSGSVSTIARVTILHGLAPGVSGFGGGIYNIGNLTVTSCEIRENNAAQDGGGIYSSGSNSTLDVNSSLINGNSAGDKGGGIAVRDGALNVTASQIGLNGAHDGGGIYLVKINSVPTALLSGVELVGNIAAGDPSNPGKGAGIYADVANLTLSGNTRIHQNIAQQANSQGGGLWATGGTVTFRGVIVENNEAATGDGIYLAPTVTLTPYTPGVDLILNNDQMVGP